uniref:DUF834 domain-containing protein n=1 Tax=Oryza rufipogon TaxID=4529 RepID=A0A0E0P535_ORYRU
MARRGCADSPAITVVEVTARRGRWAVRKRRAVEIDADSQQASGGSRGGCRRRGGRVLGAGGVHYLTEEQHACGYMSDAERHPSGGFIVDSDDEASGGVPNSDLPLGSGFVLDSKDEVCGGDPESELPPEGTFVPDSEGACNR